MIPEKCEAVFRKDHAEPKAKARRALARLGFAAIALL
jgi:hypothetical protein